jgi:uncharacterized protein YbaR (Trm112 family)
MTLDPELLAILVCPEDKTALNLASEEQIAALNTRITAGKISNRGDNTVEMPLQAGLIRKDGGVLYPIRDGIPVLLKEEGISL